MRSTNGGAALVISLILWCGSARATTTYNYSAAGVQTFTAPEAGFYTIVVYGAEGGIGYTDFGQAEGGGGGGAEIIAYINLTLNQTIDIYVGQSGFSGAAAGGGGGGGTFVVTTGGTPLVIAGGGGGGVDSSFPGGGGQVGSNTYGGGGSTTNSGGSGAGFSGNGGGGFEAGGGFDYADGFGGGSGAEGGGNGGYGGGGGGEIGAGGGGGGATGGNGGFGSAPGTGGTSYVDPSVIIGIETAGANFGDGEVQIDFGVPEPASFALSGLGLLILFAAARKRLSRQTTD